MKYDIENLIEEMKDYLQAKLPAKLLEIENEKIAQGKGLTGGLPAPSNAAYYEQAWDNNILNHPEAIYFGVEDNQADDPRQGSTALNYKIFFEIILTGSNQYGDKQKRMHRYSRALREVFETYCAKNSFISRTKIETVRPISFKLEVDTTTETNVGGVSISASIA